MMQKHSIVFFVGLYLGCTIKQLDDNTYSSSQLHFPNKKLYVVEDNTEKILSYDFSDIIDLISFASNLSD